MLHDDLEKDKCYLDIGTMHMTLESVPHPYSYYAGSREELRAGVSFIILDHWSSSHRKSAYFHV